MRKKSLLNTFHIKTSSCIHQINSHARYIVAFDQWNRNYYKEINSFEFEIFATVYNRDMIFAKFSTNEIDIYILTFQEKRRHDLIDRFEIVDDKSTFYKDIRHHIEWNSTLLKMQKTWSDICFNDVAKTTFDVWRLFLDNFYR